MYLTTEVIPWILLTALKGIMSYYATITDPCVLSENVNILNKQGKQKRSVQHSYPCFKEKPYTSVLYGNWRRMLKHTRLEQYFRRFVFCGYRYHMDEPLENSSWAQ